MKEQPVSYRNVMLFRIRQASNLGGPSLKVLTQALELHVATSKLAAFAEVVERCAVGELTSDLETLVSPLIDGQYLHLWGTSLQFQTRTALLTILEEILVRREYHFRSLSPAPTVIDAGANIGLASYYMHRSCNAKRLICFEPNPATFAVLAANAEAGKWPAELHCGALAGANGEASFTLSNESPLAAALDPRSIQKDSKEILVRTMRLRPFLLDQPIGLLKIDIEGAEAEVLEDCEGSLDLVENIFCEVHPIPGHSPSLLLRVLGVLERAGFMVHVSRSPWSELAHRTRPLTHANRIYSLSIFATRIKA